MKKIRQNSKLKNRKILISGAGIAGPCLAYWLKLYGFRPTIVERSPKIREGGYAIDVRGAGAEVAKLMGLWARIEEKDTKLSALALMDQNTNKVHKVNMRPFIKYLKARGSWIEVMRTDLSKMLFDKSQYGVEYIFGDSIKSLKDNGNGLDVKFESGKGRQFDLVIGADGLHSNVRKLAFGPESKLEYYCGYYIAVATIDNFLKLKHTHELFSIPNKSIDLYSNLDESKSIAFFMFRKKTRIHFDFHNTEEQKNLLSQEFANINDWEVPKILEKAKKAPDFFFDSVSQIRMPKWSKGRVVLIGDAAFAPSFLTGQGSQLAMRAAYTLAEELKNANGDYRVAYKKYEESLRPEVEFIQKNIRLVGEIMIPSSRTVIWLRNHLIPILILLLRPFVQFYNLNKSKPSEGVRE